MSDNIVDFDLSKPVQEVKRFDDALDRLNKQMENINKRDFRKLVAEVENMRNIGTEAQRKFATDAAATANKIMQSWDLSAMSKKQRTELKSALDKLHSDMVAFYRANADVAVRFNDQHWKQLIEGARRNGRSYTEVSFTTDREIIAGRAKTYKTLEQLEAAHNEATLKASKTLADLRAKSATPMNLDETRRLLGLPDRDGMKSFAATIKGQMQEALSSEKLRAKSATPMNLDETRRLLGLPDRDGMKSFAATIKGQMQEALSSEKLRAKSATPMNLDETRRLLGLPDRSQMDRLAAQIRGQMLEAVDLSKYQKIARGRGINVQDVVGEFSVLPTGPKAVKLPDPAQINGVSTALKRLTIDGNDAHSMARGLASGFNLLWLTWGKLVPLFTGASISFGLKKTFDIGSEVEYQIKFMEVLGQTTVTQSGIIRQALREIDQTTQFTLVELSQAMVRLQQAGQSPKEALATLKPAADLASLGMVDLKISTDLLIQTQALFGKTAADSSKMAAQIFEITKSGVLNVEDIAGSMKYASEANTRFGKTLEETLTLLGALAQAGLKANSGGTAYINFLRDLNGRSGPAIAAMKALEKATGTTIKVFDEFGKQRTAIDIFNDIAKAAAKLKAEDADKILSKIFKDRGGRLFYAMVREGNVELSKMVEHLEKVKPEVLLDAAKGLMDTTKGALNILQGTLVGALDQVFEANSVKFKTFIKDLTGAIDSEGFKNTVHGIVAGVNSIYESIQTLMPVLQMFGAAWLVFKAGSIGVAVFQGISAAIAGMAPILGMTGAQLRATTAALTTSTGAWVANGTAVIGNAAAQRAAAAGMDAAAASAARTAATTAVAGAGMRGVAAIVGFMANPIVGVITTLGLLGAAFFSAKSDAEKAMSGTTNSILENGKINLAQWDKEIARLRDRNALMGKTDTYSGAESELTVARENLAKESADYLKILNKYEQESAGASERQLSVLSSRYDRVLKSKLASITSQQETINKAQARVDEARMKDLSEREEEERQRAAKFKTAPHGDIPLPAGGSPGFDRRTYQDVKIASENTLSTIQKNYNTQKSLAQTQADDERAILEAKHKAMLIGEGRYQAELQANTLASEQNLLRIANESRAEYVDNLSEQMAKIVTAIAKAESTPVKNQADIDARKANVESLTQVLHNLAQTAESDLGSMDADAAKLASNIAKYLKLAAINSAGELRKLSEESRKYWKADAEELSKLKTADKLAAKYQFVADTVLSTGKAEQAYEEASSAMMEKHLSRINELEQKYSDVAAEAEYFAEVLRALGPAADEAAIRQYTDAENRLKNLRKSIDAEKVNAANSATAAGELAFERMRKKQIGEFSSALADGVMTGLEEGGEAGKKKLRDTIVNELKKPVFMVINAVINAGLSSLLGGGMGGGAGNAGGGILGGIQTASNLNTLWGAGSQALYGTTAGASAASLGYANLVGMAGGDAIGALATANGMWAGVATGAQAAAQSAIAANLAIEAGAAEALPAGTLATAVGGTEAVGGTAAAGGISGALSAIPVWGWVLAAAAVLWKPLFGRKLKDTGIEGTFGGEAGFEGQQYRFYKGGLFRSDKTKYSAIDPKLDSSLDAAVRQMQQSMKSLANSLDLPTEAITGFTQSIKLSFNGLDEAGIQAKVQKALTGYNEALAGAFIESMENSEVPAWVDRLIGNTDASAVQRLQDVAEWPARLLQSFGTSRDDLVRMFTEGLASGDAMAAGQSVADTLVASVQNAVLTNAAGQIFDIVNQGIVTPMLDAIATGASVSEALSQATIDKTIERATEQAQALGALFGNAEFAAALAQLRTAVGGALGQAGGYLQTVPRTLSVIAPTGTGTTAADPLQKYYDDRKSLEIELATVMGDTGKAYDLITAGMGAAEKAAYDFNEGLRTQIRYQTSLNTLREESATLGIDLLRAQGREEEALAAERTRAIEGYDAYQTALYDSNMALRAQITELERLAEVASSIESELPAVIAKYQTPEQQVYTQYATIAADLIKTGLSGAGAQELTQALMGASKEDIAKAAVEIYNLSTTTDDMRLAIIRAASGLADLKDSANSIGIEKAEAAYAVLEKAVEKQKSVLQETIKNITGVFDITKDASKALFGEVKAVAAMQAAQGRSFITAALAAAKMTGALPDSAKLGEAISAARSGLDAQVYESQAEANFQRLVLANELRGLQDISGDQLDEAEKQLKALDKILETASSQLDALRGVNNSVLSVADALSAFNATLTQVLSARAGGAVGAGTVGAGTVGAGTVGAGTVGAGTVVTNPNSLTKVYNGINGAQYDAGSGIGYAAGSGLPWLIETIRADAQALLASGQDAAVIEAIKSQGYTHDQAESMLGMDLPQFRQGINKVPYDMTARIHKDEAVVPAQFNPYNPNFASTQNAKLEALVEELTQEVRLVKKQLADTHKEQRRTANAVNGNSEMPMLVETV